MNGRTAQHESYACSIKHHKHIEEAYGWTRAFGGMAQTLYRGVGRVRSCSITAMVANNPALLPQFLAA